jgi:hypothetical protein
MTISGTSRHRLNVRQPRRRLDKRYLYVVAGVVVLAVAGVAYAIIPGGGSSNGTTPMVAAQNAGSLLLNANGAEVASWDKTSTYCGSDSISVANGKVGTSADGDATLTTNGTSGSCAAIISPNSYSSAIIEADIDFPALPGKSSVIADWTSFWITDEATWPVDGELDAVEASPLTGKSAVSWHSGPNSSSVFVASSDGFHKVTLPTKGADVTPGWHTVDIVYTKGYFGVYYDGHLYASYTSSEVTGSALNIMLTSTVTPKTAAAWNMIGGPEVNSDSAPATTSVKYLRVWAYK